MHMECCIIAHVNPILRTDYISGIKNHEATIPLSRYCQGFAACDISTSKAMQFRAISRLQLTNLAVASVPSQSTVVIV